MRRRKEQTYLFIEAAALHDVIIDKSINLIRSRVEAGIEKEFLISIEVTPEQVEAIESIITRMSFKVWEQQELSLEGKVVQDADRLDAVVLSGLLGRCTLEVLE